MIWDWLVAPFADFAFMRRALVGCIALAIGSAPVGVFLVLRRMSLMSDAMSHAILPGAALGFLLGGLSVPAMAAGGLVAGIAIVLLSGLVARRTILKEDASLATFYLISLAAGVLLVSLRGTNVDLLHFLFGTVLALDDAAVIFLGASATLTLAWFALFYRALVIESVDPRFLRLSGRSGALTHLSFLSIAVLNLVAGFQALGTLLAVGLMILPAVAARLWARTLPAILLAAIAIACASGWIGLLLSFHAGWPSGPAIILSAGTLYGASILLGPAGGGLARWAARDPGRVAAAPEAHRLSGD